MNGLLAAQAILLLAMLAGSFFFSSSETALFSLSARHLRGLDGEDRRGARVRRLLEQPQRLLVLLLLGNTAVNIAAAEISHLLVDESAEQWGLTPAGATALSVFVATGLLLVLGEIGPKTLALHRPAAVAKTVAGPLLVLDRTVGPVVRVLFDATARTLRLLRIDRTVQAQVSEEELKTLVTVGEEEGVLEEDEREMIGRVFDLGDTLVREVCVPRTDMIRVPADATIADVLAVAKEHGHARIPVIGDTIDDVRGLVYVKDLVPDVRDGNLDRPIAQVMRPASVVPDTKRAGDCLRDFRRQRIHLAIVVDEYGGTAGLVTLEDLIEEIVGEIFDEYDEVESPITQVDERRWRVDASVPLTDLEHEWGAGLLPETEYDTLGGLVLELFGRFPGIGEQVERGGITYRVEGVTHNRLRRVVVGFPADGAIRPQPNGNGRNGGAGRNGS